VSRVLIVGVGGLGCPAALALAPHAAQLTLVDDDRVDLSNLHRQPWHHAADVGRLKVESATEKLRAQFPELRVVSLSTRVTQANAKALFDLHDVVIDGTDGGETKFMLNEAAVRTGTTLIYGGVLRLAGQAMRIERGGPCLRCLFEGPPPDAPTCAQAGVLGSVAGVVGGLQAELAFRRNAVPGEATLKIIDGLKLTLREVKVTKAADCPVCG
jgi:adenylyltransferase/sulfurtransferase